MSQIVVKRPVEEEDEDDEAKVAWLRSEITGGIRESVRKNVKNQLAHLHAACGQSTDPEVRGAYAKYHELRVMLAMLEEGQ